MHLDVQNEDETERNSKTGEAIYVEEPPRRTRKTAEVRSWCNCTGQLLTVAGPERWFHRRGSAYDLCGAVYDELPDGANGKESFVRVLAAADLGTEADSCIYRVASSHEHPDLHEQQQPMYNSSLLRH